LGHGNDCPSRSCSCDDDGDDYDDDGDGGDDGDEGGEGGVVLEWYAMVVVLERRNQTREEVEEWCLGWVGLAAEFWRTAPRHQPPLEYPWPGEMTTKWSGCVSHGTIEKDMLIPPSPTNHRPLVVSWQVPQLPPTCHQSSWKIIFKSLIQRKPKPRIT